jgi:gamma-glutamylcyclotransferase (GGCT)/AIG2-like uncharacterized protein YtfP
MTKRVFVYGSLSEGFVHFDKIAGAVHYSEKARVNGAAYQLRVGYPVLLKENSQAHSQEDRQHKIAGQLVELNSTDLMIPLLDGFYGFSSLDPSKSLHFRELGFAELESGETVECWVYYLNPKKLPPTARLIHDGDWESRIRGPKFTDQLSDRQKIYIRRLGAATGREVVPIDLPLYRELMNLELIVDKGRRLALSKFGQEVCRYLGDHKTGDPKAGDSNT